ncbi:amidohydrolase family protein [Novosphingobium terrae]|uniref:amidohydrolase family protein n=1 Tax=Novosphingobium terrae TaxID=2726189 RepID=UPI001981DEB4|nr:amidohydrolase family protein [Novosphingobium terrae]
MNEPIGTPARTRVVAVEEHFRTPELEAVLDGPEKLFPKILGENLADIGEKRLAAMDAAGIDVQVLSSAAPHVQWMEPDQAVDVACRVNDRLAEAVAVHPDRFAGLATLATPAPVDAARELERCVRDLDFRGAMIHGHTGGRFLDDQFFWPMLEAAEALDVPLYLHPGYAPKAVVDAYYSNLPPAFGAMLSTGMMGWHYEVAMHSMRMVLNGVFQRFPRLQLIIGHGGEGLPFFLDRSIKVLNRASPEMSQHLKDVYRGNFYVTTAGFFYDAPMRCAMEVTPIDRILFAADHPYASASEGTAWIRSTVTLDEEQRRKVMHENSDRLFRLDTLPQAKFNAAQAGA